MNHQKVTSKRATFTKAEREYVKGIVRNLSFQRFTDREIVHWLHEEKKIELDRSTISKMRKHAEKDAEKWYIELRESGSKYIAIYKERLDSLLSYQKKLHEIINNNEGSDSNYNPEIALRAISEIHRIEISLHTLLKELPDFQISELESKSKEKEKARHMTFDEWMERYQTPRVDVDSAYTEQENGQYYWGLHKRYQEYVKDWETQNFGPDPDGWLDEPKASQLPKAIGPGPY